MVQVVTCQREKICLPSFFNLRPFSIADRAQICLFTRTTTLFSFALHLQTGTKVGLRLSPTSFFFKKNHRQAVGRIPPSDHAAITIFHFPPPSFHSMDNKPHIFLPPHVAFNSSFSLDKHFGFNSPPKKPHSIPVGGSSASRPAVVCNKTWFAETFCLQGRSVARPIADTVTAASDPTLSRRPCTIKLPSIVQLSHCF